MVRIIFMLCLFSCIAVDDDNDDFDDLTSISRIMNILCYLSWSVDFSTYNDDDKDGDDDDDEVSTVYATFYSITIIYLSIHLSSTLLFDNFFTLVIWSTDVYHDSIG